MLLTAAEPLSALRGGSPCGVEVKRESAIPCLGVEVKKSKPTHNSSLESPGEVSDACCVAGAFVR